MKSLDKKTLNLALNDINSIGDLADTYEEVINHIKKLILETPNDYDLGEKLRSFGIDYLEVFKNK